jgi:hypothetical protein
VGAQMGDLHVEDLPKQIPTIQDEPSLQASSEAQVTRTLSSGGCCQDSVRQCVLCTGPQRSHGSVDPRMWCCHQATGAL